MVDVDNRRPDVRIVAVLADIGRLHVQWPFAGCISTVMTGDTIVHDSRMVKIRWRPGDGCVAVITVIATADMRRVFACGRDAIMTGATSTNDLCVINGKDRYPDI